MDRSPTLLVIFSDGDVMALGTRLVPELDLSWSCCVLDPEARWLILVLTGRTGKIIPGQYAVSLSSKAHYCLDLSLRGDQLVLGVFEMRQTHSKVLNEYFEGPGVTPEKGIESRHERGKMDSIVKGSVAKVSIYEQAGVHNMDAGEVSSKCHQTSSETFEILSIDCVDASFEEAAAASDGKMSSTGSAVMEKQNVERLDQLLSGILDQIEVITPEVGGKARYVQGLRWCDPHFIHQRILGYLPAVLRLVGHEDRFRVLADLVAGIDLCFEVCEETSPLVFPESVILKKQLDHLLELLPRRPGFTCPYLSGNSGIMVLGRLLDGWIDLDVVASEDEGIGFLGQGQGEVVRE